MNHIYRLCWNRTLRAWVPASELAKGKAGGASRGSSAARIPLMLSLLSLSMGMSGLAWAGSTPTGGQVVGGSGSITQSGNLTTIQQNSQTLSLNWQSFDIGANQTVDFLQPGRDSIAVNRILGNTASDIEGHLNANGQVWLVNPNGVLFGKNAQVDVGGIVASTLDLDQGTPGNGTVRFAGNGKGSVVNLGTITVTPGGYAALLGGSVSNQGTIRAQLGTVALAGGTAMTLTFADNHLMHLVVDANTVKSLVENRQLIVADGGQVLMTAGARNSLIDSAVNNTGTVQAQTVQDHDGTITLLGGMEAGTVNVAGTLDASAPQGGKGGFIETSGAHAHIADGSVITTKASANGQNGTWLVDPADFTIAASGGDITATQLATNLASGNVTLTSAQGTVNTNGSGNVNVNQAVTWGANTTLTLTASNNVNLNAAITNTGASGKTVLNATNAFVNNVGAAGLKGNWAIYSASPTATGEKLNGLAPGFIQYNAPIGTAAATGATGNGLFYASAASINITGLANASKTYDGTTNLLTSQLTDTLSGGGSGDTLTAIAGGYSQSDVGTGLKITAPTAGSAYTIVNGGVPVYGYTVNGASSANSNAGVITAAQLYATVIGDPTKVYDGTTTVNNLTSSNFYITGLVSGQSINVGQPSSVGYASADVNTTNGGLVAINATFTRTNFTAGSGTKLSNYLLPTATSITTAAQGVDSTAGYGNITPAPVYLSGVLTSNKTYDATSSDTLSIGNASIYGVVNGDNVTLDTKNAAGNFANANAGNNKAVTLSGFTLDGTATKVADYNLILPTNLTANINPAPLTVTGIQATNKVYDGTFNDNLNTSGATLSGFVGTDTGTLTGTASGAFSQSDVGNNLAVTVNGLSVSNANYTVTAPTGLTANITPKALTISFSNSANKVYDGTSYATLPTGDFSVTGAVLGQTVTVSQAPAVYTNANGVQQSNVGTYTTTASLQSSDLDFDAASGAKAGNYTFNTSVSGTGQITPAPLTLVINGNPTKTYDGTSTATLGSGNYMLSGLISGQSITLGGSLNGNYYDTGTGGTNPNSPPPASSYESNVGTWGVVSTLASGNYTAGSGTLLSNYILPTTALGYGTITPKGITAVITAGVTGTKVYDGNTSITLAGSDITFNGFLNGDKASASNGIAGTFATPNVGGQPLTATLNVNNMSVTCAAGGTACLGDYYYAGNATTGTGIAGDTLNSTAWTNGSASITAYGTGSIIAKNLYITLNGVTKQYDGNTSVLPLNNSNFIVYGYANNDTGGAQDAGWVSGQGATITPTASFTYASPNVARDANGNVLGNIEVKGSLTYQNYAPNANTQLSNYNLVYGIDQDVGKITPAPLYVSGVTAENKIYDGGTGAWIDINNGQLNGLVNEDKNASAITLAIGNATASTVDGVTGSNTAGTIVPNSNGTFTGTPSPVAGTFAGVGNAGANQVVTTTYSLGGTSAGNYNLQPISLTANIAQRPLTVSGLVANNKTYDGTTTASFTFNSPTFSQANGQGSSVNGLLAQDTANVGLNKSSGTGTFATANANMTPGALDANGNPYSPGAATGAGTWLSANGHPITVTANGFTLNGSAAGNYVLSQPTGLSADIAQRQIVAQLGGTITKVYDGTSSITIPASGYSISASTAGTTTAAPTGWVSGQGASITQTQSAYYGDPNNPQSNVGSYDVTANLVSSDWKPTAGTSLSNYALPTQVVGQNVGIITPYVLDLSATRVYDATSNIYSSYTNNVTNGTNASAFGTLTGLNGDQFTVTGTGAMAAKDVGTYSGTGLSGQPTSGQGFNLGTLALAAVGNANAGNYTLVGGTDTYIVTQAPLNVTGATVAPKVYNASTAATVTGATLTQGASAGDVLGNDVVTISNSSAPGTFASPNANAGLTGTATTPTAVTINSAAITGTDAQDYYIVQPTGLAGTINQAPVTIQGTRQYNGNANAVLASTTWTVSGTVGGQTLRVGSGSGTVNSPNVGSYTDTAGTFNVGTLALGNGTGQASNYGIATGGNQFFIIPYQINLTGSSIYNGTATAGATSGSFSGVSTTNGSFSTGVNGETLNLGGSYALANNGNVTPNGTGGGTASKQTTSTPATGGAGLGGLTIASGSGAAGNYVLYSVNYTVNPVVLSFTGSKTYDGSSSFAASTLGALTGGFVGSDQVTVSGTGVLSSANAGNYGTGASGILGTPSSTATIGVGGLKLTGVGATNANNYTLIGGTDTYLINKATINLVGVRQYTGNGNVANSNVTLINGTPGACAAGNTCWGASTNNVYSGDLGKLTVVSNNSTVTSPGNVGTYTDNGGGFSDADLALGGSAAGNYTLAATGNKFIINPYQITLTGSSTYNGATTIGVTGSGAGSFAAGTNTVSSSNGTFSTGIGTETLTLGGAFSLPNGGNVTGNTNGNGVGTAVNQSGSNGLTLSSVSGSGVASNYAISNVIYTVTPAVLTVSGGRQYDSTTKVANGNVTLGGLVGSQILTLNGTGTVSSANASGAAYTGTGVSGNPTSGQGFNLGSLALGNGTGANGGIASNYTLVGGTDTFTISPKQITITGTRQYDGKNDADASVFGNNGTISTGVNGETLQVADATAGTPGTIAGVNANLTTPYAINDPTAYTLQNAGTGASAGLASNYVLTGGSVTVTRKVLNLTGTRTYDGTTTIYSDGTSGSSFSAITGVNGDTFTLTGAGTTSGKNVNGGTAYTGTGSTGTGQGFNLGTLGLVAVGGANAGNYTLVGGTDAYTLTPLAITVGTTASNKIYDGTTTATVAVPTSSGVLGSDQVTFTDTGATFASPNVAHDANGNVIAQTVTVSGITAHGADAGNYTVNTTATTTASITPYVLGFSGTRQYDGTANVDGSDLGTLSGVGGDQFTVSGQGTSYSANAGTYSATNPSGTPTGTQQIGVNGLTLNNAGSNAGTELAGNYTLAGTPTNGGTDTYTIARKVLNLTGTRTYDGTTTIYSDGTSGSSFAAITGVNGDTFTLTGAGTTSGKNVNGGTAYTGTGSTGTGQGFNLGTLGLVAVGSANANNYTLVGGTDSYVLVPATLTVANTTVDTKTYDGNTAATLKGATLAGVIGSDNVTLGNDTTGTYATPNAGTGIGVTASTMTIGGGDAGNYTLVQPSGLTGTITPVVLDLTGTRVYDGTANAAASLFGNGGVLAGVNGETLTLAGTGTLSSKNVGMQQPFASNGLSGFTLTGNGTALAGNYTLAGGTDWVTITPLAITVNATGKDKTYDGNTAAGVTLGSSGVLAGDTVAFTDGSANFSSPNAGTGVPIAVTGITASGGDAGNYTFNTTASTSATINPYALDLTGTRVYDATTHAYGSDFGTVTGLGGDTFSVSGAGSVSSKNVGSYSGVGGSGFDLGNLALASNGTGLSSNYTLVGGMDTYTIMPATLTVVGTTVGTKTYDGTTTASLGGATLTGVLGGDNVTLGNDTAGTFATPNAGTGIAVSTGMTIGGGDAGNYVIVQPTGLTGTINPYVLDLTGTRVYDGTTSAVAGLFGNGGVLTGIDGQTVILSGTGQVGDKNVGTGKPFASLGTLALSDGSNGGLGGNYTLIGGTDTLSITPKTIAVDATGTNKMYDGNTLDTVTLGSGGVVAGDSVQFGYGAANFANPNVGNNILVTVTGVQLSGVDAGNYLLASPTVYTHADITGALPTAFGISNGVYASIYAIAVGPSQLVTPYGTTPQVVLGPFTGNKQKLHKPVQRNVWHGDFSSGLALKVVDGGLRVPVQAMP